MRQAVVHHTHKGGQVEAQRRYVERVQTDDGSPKDRVDATRVDDRKWKGGTRKDPVDEHLRDDEGGNEGGNEGGD